MKHICVFLAYQNIEHIKLSFESMYLDSVDYFIVENFSENSDSIKEFFTKKKLKGYIQFEKNISATAVNIFIKNFYNLLCSYDIITITDGDLFIYDIKDAFQEIIQNLHLPSVGISSISLFQDNNYTNKERIIGVDNYINKQKTFSVSSPVFIQNGNYLTTFKKEDIHHLTNVHYLDSCIYNYFLSMNKASVATSKNTAYHLTWDLYFDGNPYYEWKKQVIKHIWRQQEDCKFIKII